MQQRAKYATESGRWGILAGRANTRHLRKVHQRWVAKKGTGPTENDIDRIYGKYLTTTEDVPANNSALISGL